MHQTAPLKLSAAGDVQSLAGERFLNYPKNLSPQREAPAMRLYGQVLKLAIGLYLVSAFMPVGSSPLSTFVNRHKLWIGVLLLLNFVAFYVIDSIHEYVDITRRERRLARERVDTGDSPAVPEAVTCVSESTETRRRALRHELKTSMVAFGLCCTGTLLSVGSAVAFPSLVVRIPAIVFL